MKSLFPFWLTKKATLTRSKLAFGTNRWSRCLARSVLVSAIAAVAQQGTAMVLGESTWRVTRTIQLSPLGTFNEGTK